jgi:hypothetical protein
MSRMNIYQGGRSAYARFEGAYAPGSGVSLATAVPIAALILRDLRRGWTYDHGGSRVPMTPELARRRLWYLYPLCIKHTGSGCEHVMRLAALAFLRRQIPPEYAHLVRLEGPNAARVMAELARLGIVPAAAVPVVVARVGAR